MYSKNNSHRLAQTPKSKTLTTATDEANKERIIRKKRSCEQMNLISMACRQMINTGSRCLQGTGVRRLGFETEMWSVSCCMFKHDDIPICAKTE